MAKQESDERKSAKIFKGGREPKTADAKGRVRVYLTLVNPEDGKNVTGNISSALYINGASVSEVEKRITKHFGG